MAKRLEGNDPPRPAAGRPRGQLPPPRLGHLAPALLGLPDPGDPLPDTAASSRCPTADLPVEAAGRRLLRPARQPARPPPDVEARRLPEMRRRGGPRNRHHGHLRRFVLVFRPLHRAARPKTPTEPRRGQSLAAGRPVYRRHRARDPAPPLFPLLHPGDEGDRPSRPRRAVCRPVHAGHGRPRDLPARQRPERPVDRAGRGQSVEERDGQRRATLLATGEEVEIGPIEKMSKSRRNTVDPSDIMESYGADTARWFMLSDSPPDRDVIWTEEGVAGAYRFVQRVWRLVAETRAAPAARPIRRRRRAKARRRTRCARRPTGRSPRSATTSRALRFNVAVARIYELVNAIGARRATAGRRRSLARTMPCARRSNFSIQMMAPMMPHLAEECWAALGHARSGRRQRHGREFDRSLLVEDVIVLPVQVNGKKRGELTIAADASQADVERATSGARFRRSGAWGK